MLKVSSTSSIVSAVVGTDTVPVVAQQQLLYVSSRVITLPAVPFVRTKVYEVSTAEGLLR
jgi:hypothetical protein